MLYVDAKQFPETDRRKFGSSAQLCLWRGCTQSAHGEDAVRRQKLTKTDNETTGEGKFDDDSDNTT